MAARSNYVTSSASQNLPSCCHPTGSIQVDLEGTERAELAGEEKFHLRRRNSAAVAC